MSWLNSFFRRDDDPVVPPYTPTDFPQWSPESVEILRRKMVEGCKRPPNRVYESMTKVVRFGLTVRVWHEAETFTMGPNTEVRDFINKWDGNGPKEFAHEMAEKISGIAAIEIINVDGCGALLYPDWK